MALEVIANQTYLGQTVQNVFRFDGTEANVANAEAICDGIAEAWTVHLLNRLSTEWTIDSFSYREIGAPTGTPYTLYIPTGLPLNGSNTMSPLPPFMAILLSFSTGAQPPYRGRTYLAGFGDNVIDTQGQVSAATQTEVLAFWDDLADMSDEGLSDVFPIILSGTSPNYPANIPAPILGRVCRPDFATQRRRIRGRGI